jgi:hypothetical protein
MTNYLSTCRARTMDTRNRFVGVVTHRNCYVTMSLNETGL